MVLDLPGFDSIGAVLVNDVVELYPGQYQQIEYEREY